MTKKILIFLGGIITGVVILIIVGAILSSHDSVGNGIVLFKEPGDCVSTNSFKIFQVLETGDALANEISDDYDADLHIPTGLTVLFLNKNGNAFYDDQIIRIPLSKCAKQIGVFRYISQDERERTVPIVEVLNR